MSLSLRRHRRSDGVTTIVTARRHRRHVTSGGSQGLPHGFEATPGKGSGSIPGVTYRTDRAGPPVGDPALVELRTIYAAYTTSRCGFRVARRVVLSGESWRTETETSLS